ncbi:hypothetical protein KUTeg_011061 [Tegillarca granosa]|uniref:Secreted protein n=1 Tax=Tegillarca granosa TaxID=220873 RepID=A0ABQ9F2U0_TEGGR|nr:hypothetical protein KUTeg_011061 [Tegillarca granosa]
MYFKMRYHRNLFRLIVFTKLLQVIVCDHLTRNQQLKFQYGPLGFMTAALRVLSCDVGRQQFAGVIIYVYILLEVLSDNIVLA